MSAGDTPEDTIRAIGDGIATYFEACQSMGLDPSNALHAVDKKGKSVRSFAT